MSRARWPGFAAGLLALGGLVAAGVGRGRQRAARHAHDLRREASALAACALGEHAPEPEGWHESLHARLALLGPDEAPLAACVPLAAQLEASRQALAATRWRRSARAAPDLAEASARLVTFPLGAPARDLSGRADALAAALRTAVAGACQLATAEDGDPSCLPPPSPRPPARPRDRVLDVPTTAEAAAWVVTASENDVSVRVASGGRAWEIRSLDAGQHFTALALPGESPGPEEAPQLLARAGARRVLLRVSYGTSGPWSRLVEITDRAARDAGPLAGLAEAGAAAPLGVRAVETASGWVAVGRDAAGRGLVGGRLAPAGELVGVFQEGGARLLLKHRTPSGFVGLTTVPVPTHGEPWPAGVEATVAYVAALQPTADVERTCGLPDERYGSWVGAAGDGAVLVAASSQQIHAYRFHATAGASYRVVCGSCPPMALEARPDGLGLFVPIRRSLVPARIAVPLAFEPGRSGPTAQAACTPSALAVVYEADGKILVQQREPGGWRLQPAIVLAEPDAQGRPVEPAIVGVGDSLVVLWRRRQPGRLMIESHRLVSPS